MKQADIITALIVAVLIGTCVWYLWKHPEVAEIDDAAHQQQGR